MIHTKDPDTGISLYFHCAKCLDGKPADQSPQEWSRTQTGVTPRGDLVVWCTRHNCAVAKFVNRTLSTTLASIAHSQCDGESCRHETTH